MKTILVVDDEFGIAEVLSSLLTDEGYRVVIATNGRAALERVREIRPDLVLLDFMMPVLDGPATLEALKADDQYRDIPVVMMSAVAESAVRQRTHDYARFLRKPFDATSLLDVLDDLIGGP